MEKRFYYFAYGSNMETTRMLARCPSARMAGVAKLKGYRLAERLYADIETAEVCAVGGVLWSVTLADLCALDSFEGVAAGAFKRGVYAFSTPWGGGRRLRLRDDAPDAAGMRGEAFPTMVQGNLPVRRTPARDVRGILQQNNQRSMTMGMKIHKVAVYGTLMAGERNERWAADALDRRSCVLRGTLYDTGWTYPAFVPVADDGKVKAELLTVTEATLARMDALEGYPRLYRREVIPTVLGDRSVETAMVYVMNKLPRRVKSIPSGDWQAYRRNRGM